MTAAFETDTGELTGLTLSTTSGAGFIPVTVPITMNVSEPYGEYNKDGLINSGQVQCGIFTSRASYIANV